MSRSSAFEGPGTLARNCGRSRGRSRAWNCGRNRSRNRCRNRSRNRCRNRGQVEPFAALAAVLAVGLALSLYATVLSDADPGGSDPATAETTVDRVYRHVSDGSVVDPEQIPQAPAVAPAGYQANVTLAADGRSWQAGPTPPESAERASRRVSVRLAPGNVRPGRLTVVIWS